MPDKNYRHCCVCGKAYKYCNSCRGFNPLETWRITFCSENCKEIYNALSAYSDKRMIAQEAFDKLGKLDLSKRDNFGESYKKVIADITSKVREETKVEVPDTIEEAVPVTEDTVESTEEIIKEQATETAEPVEEVELTPKKNYRKSKKRTSDVE